MGKTKTINWLDVDLTIDGKEIAPLASISLHQSVVEGEDGFPYLEYMVGVKIDSAQYDVLMAHKRGSSLKLDSN